MVSLTLSYVNAAVEQSNLVRQSQQFCSALLPELAKTELSHYLHEPLFHRPGNTDIPQPIEPANFQ